MSNTERVYLPETIDKARFTRRDLNDILIFCAENGASDITFQTNNFITAEIEGNFHFINNHKLNSGEMEGFASGLYRSDKISALVKGGSDVDGSYDVKYGRGQRFRFRYNVVGGLSEGNDGMEITCRTISGIPPKLEDLGIEQEITDNIMPKQGIIPVVGATGSGKSTLLASIIREMLEEKDGNRKVVTFESPVEYVYEEVEKPSSIIWQTEVPGHLSDFTTSVRNSLRRKPNVILIGESRDAETIGESINASMTGHALYTTVHANGVADTVRRMVNVFPEGEKNARAMDLISSLKVIVAQQLIPSVDNKRVAIREYLVFDQEVIDILLEAGVENLMMATRKLLNEKGQTFLQAAKKQYDAGNISEFEYRKIKHFDSGVETDMQDVARSNIKKGYNEVEKDINQRFEHDEHSKKESLSKDSFLESDSKNNNSEIFIDTNENNEIIDDDYEFAPFVDPDLNE